MASDLLLPTGIKSLDDILGGGLPVAGNVLLYGEPLCGKKPLMMQFVWEGLRMNIPGIFVLTDYGFAEWKSMMEGSGWSIAEYEQNGLLQVIDCYSKQFNPSLVDEGIVTYVNGSTDLSAISMQLSGLQDQIVQIADNHRLGFHSLSSLLETNSPESVFRFMQFVTGKFRRYGCIAMYAMEKGMHEEKHVAMIEHLMDGVVEFSEEKLRVRGLIGASPSWHKYEVGASGVEIKV
ncbi:MAG: RAD55 family ATPase [Candidatus Micrarchaeota archaeon]|nr:RAD55 family ATPase [Candidatus Micrarchaeota archaeon]